MNVNWDIFQDLCVTGSVADGCISLATLCRSTLVRLVSCGGSTDVKTCSAVRASPGETRKETGGAVLVKD